MSIYILIILFLLPIGGCQPQQKSEVVVKPREQYKFQDVELEEWKKIIFTPKERYDFPSFKNPFLNPKSVAQLQKKEEFFNFELKGILIKNGKRYALLQDPLKRGYFVTEGTRFAGHYVKRIGSDYVIVLAEETDVFGGKTKREIKLNLRKEQSYEK
jgi:Tfp pilus assembly protein PilP